MHNTGVIRPGKDHKRLVTVLCTPEPPLVHAPYYPRALRPYKLLKGTTVTMSSTGLCLTVYPVAGDEEVQVRLDAGGLP
jgi:hypothetical protein